MCSSLVQLTNPKRKIEIITDPTGVSSAMESVKVQEALGWKPGKIRKTLKREYFRLSNISATAKPARL